MRGLGSNSDSDDRPRAAGSAPGYRLRPAKRCKRGTGVAGKTGYIERAVMGAEAMSLKCKSPADVLKAIKEHDVKYVDLRFTDPRGKWHHTAQAAETIDESVF